MKIGFVLIFAALAGLGLQGCIQSRCTAHSECPTGKVCVALTGECQVPECVSDSDCGTGTVCDEHFCVPGCKTDRECEADEECLGKRCLPVSPECNCPSAPQFCAEDLNPESPTSGESVCVPGSFENGVALFFGSVACIHCQGLFDALQAIAANLEADGENAQLAFVQIESQQTNPDEVDEQLENAKTPAVQDIEELKIWEAYQADFYHLVIVDQNGCLAEHLGPLALEEVQETERQNIENAWRNAMHARCEGN